MKSGLLTSMPSASQATLTPAPVASACACGVDGLSNAVLVVWSASGSSSGLAGSVGQIWLVDWALGVTPAAFGPATARSAGGTVMRIGRSGYTAWTAGLAASAATWAGVA